jgi:hypothetical protein
MKVQKQGSQQLRAGRVYTSTSALGMSENVKCNEKSHFGVLVMAMKGVTQYDLDIPQVSEAESWQLAEVANQHP